MAIEFQSQHDIGKDRTIISALVSNQSLMMQAHEAILREIIKGIAARWVEEHYAEIAVKLNPEAIANMAMAEAAAAVNETLHKKMPDKILEVVRKETEVYQRGLLGGMTRIR